MLNKVSSGPVVDSGLGRKTFSTTLSPCLSDSGLFQRFLSQLLRWGSSGDRVDATLSPHNRKKSHICIATNKVTLGEYRDADTRGPTSSPAKRRGRPPLRATCAPSSAIPDEERDAGREGDGAETTAQLIRQRRQTRRIPEVNERDALPHATAGTETRSARALPVSRLTATQQLNPRIQKKKGAKIKHIK